MENKVDTKPNNIPPVVPNPIPEDKTISCVEKDCGNQFTFTGGEQVYFKDKGLHTPKRCRTCIVKRRQKVQGPVRITEETN